jgi:hypothetical protein
LIEVKLGNYFSTLVRMNNEITFTLLSDGSSDKALLPIIKWALTQKFSTIPINGSWADFSLLPPNIKPKLKHLDQRISKALELFPSDILFIHRDAENESWEKRKEEIEEACKRLDESNQSNKIASIIPIKMTEAWLLFNVPAIRKAANNPNGSVRIDIPKIKKIETLDAKKELIKLIRIASELKGRRLEKLDERRAIHLVADYIDDYSTLRILECFQNFEKEVEAFEME